MAAVFPQNEKGPKLEPHQVIIQPLITEKGTHLSEHRKAYTFEVNLWATKTQIKAAAEQLFGVQVACVRTQIRKGKVRRYRFKKGKTSSWKKAIVVLTEQSTAIDFF